MEVTLSDSELVRLAAAGANGEAEAELFRRMAPRVRLYGLRHLRDASAADDLVQQVMLATMESLREGRLQDAEKLPSFVLGMCRMMVLDQRRRARRRESLLALYPGDVPMAAPAAMPDPDRERLARCVQGLRERERAVVVMTFFDEETGADVARFLGVSEPNVRVIRHRAIHQLRGCLGVAA